jgi:uncharacterized membrane protein YgdD (TMEM256/DUF423 family)
MFGFAALYFHIETPLCYASDIMANLWIGLGSISGLIAVATGAFGAHGLADKLTPKALSVWQTAAQYQMTHALALLAVGLYPAAAASAVPGWAFTAGTVLFSGSLYMLALTDIKILGAITPFGGVGFLIGWGALAWTAFKA